MASTWPNQDSSCQVGHGRSTRYRSSALKDRSRRAPHTQSAPGDQGRRHARLTMERQPGVDAPRSSSPPGSGRPSGAARSPSRSWSGPSPSTTGGPGRRWTVPRSSSPPPSTSCCASSLSTRGGSWTSRRCNRRSGPSARTPAPTWCASSGQRAATVQLRSQRSVVRSGARRPCRSQRGNNAVRPALHTHRSTGIARSPALSGGTTSGRSTTPANRAGPETRDSGDEPSVSPRSWIRRR